MPSTTDPTAICEAFDANQSDKTPNEIMLRWVRPRKMLSENGSDIVATISSQIQSRLDVALADRQHFDRNITANLYVAQLVLYRVTKRAI